MQIFPYPEIWPTDDLQFGFDDGQVYRRSVIPAYFPLNNSSYMDMLVFSIFGTKVLISTNQAVSSSLIYFGILQPIGIGMVVEWRSQNYPPLFQPYSLHRPKPDMDGVGL